MGTSLLLAPDPGVIFGAVEKGRPARSTDSGVSRVDIKDAGEEFAPVLSDLPPVLGIASLPG